MRFSFAFVVLIATAVAVSGGIYPAKTGSAGRAKGGMDGRNTERPDDGGDNRFHLQSADGQYAFGHVADDQGRAEMRTEDGTVIGYYSYVDGDGEVVYANYVADKDGYRVVSNAGVPSASVTINGPVGTEKANSQRKDDFQKVFSDFAKRVQNKVIARRTGQKTVDPVISEGRQRPAEPETLYPAKDTKPSKHDNERNQFPDWNQVKISTTQKPTDEVKHNEGQQQQEAVDPNWDTVKITTQKSDIIMGHDNDGQGSTDDDWKSAITTTETVTKNIPLVPRRDQSRVPTDKGNSNVVIPEVHNIKEITTEIPNFRGDTETIAVIDEAENNSPAVRPEVSIITDVQTTIPNHDEPRQTTKSSIIQDDVQTISGIKQFEESSTAAISESATVHQQVIKDNEENNKMPIETDMLTTIKPLEESVPTTVDPSHRNNFQTTTILPNVDYTKNEKVPITTMSSVYEPTITTFQPEVNVDDGTAGITIGIRFVTEKNKESFEFRTLDPTDRIGTTISPISEKSEGQTQEIIWPEIPQEPIPQVLVPLDPYAEHSQTKNSDVKIMHQMNSRLVRQNIDVNEVNTTVNETAAIEMVTSRNVNAENEPSFDFPRYFLTG